MKVAERTEKPVAIVLGGTVAHIALIQKLKARGYHTVLVDYLENPPAGTHADEHVRESTLDQHRVLDVVRRHQAQLVLSPAVDQANLVACMVGEVLGLPIPHSSETARLVTDKGLMKDLMDRLGIPTPPFMVVTDELQAEAHTLNFPLVVKPVDATGSKGVRCVKAYAELDHYLAEALALSRVRRAIVEEFVEGTEVQVDYFVQDGQPTRLMTREKMKGRLEIGSVLQSIGSMVPGRLPSAAMASIDEVAQKLAAGLALRTTPLFIQAMVLGGRAQVLEFALRIGGGLSFSMIRRFTGFDIMEAAVDAYLGNCVQISIAPVQHIHATCLVYSKPGIFGRVEGAEQLLEAGVIDEFHVFKTTGMNIGATMASSERVAAFIVSANSPKEAKDKVARAQESMEIFDEQERPIMLRIPVQESARRIFHP